MHIRDYKFYITSVATGIALGVIIALVPGYIAFFALVALTMFILKRYVKNDDDFKFLISAITVSILIRFICVIVLETFLIKNNMLIKVFGYQTPDMFGDSGYYSLRSWWMAQSWMGNPLPNDVAKEIALKEYGHHGYLYFLASIYYFFGFNTILSKLFTSFFGILLSVNVFFIAKHISGNVLTRKIAFILTAFWPTLLLWSMTSLKDIPIVFFYSLLILAIFKFLRMRLSEKKDYLALGLIFFIIAIAIFLRRILNILFILPFFVALVMRFRFVRRIAMAGCVILIIYAFFNPNLMLAFKTWINERVVIFHKGSIITGGNTVKIFADKYYLFISGVPGGYYYYVSLPELIKGSLKGVPLPLIQPLPHRMGLNMTRRMALSGLMGAWYIALIAAIGGCVKLLVSGPRRKEVVILILAILSTSLSIMLTTGNIGAIMRWRSLIEPFVLIFTAQFLADNYSKFSKSAIVSFFTRRHR